MRELVLAALVVLAGCSALGNAPPPSDERALEVRNRTVEAIQGVDTYRIEQTISVHAEGDGETIDVRGTGNGSVDVEARRMGMHVSMEGTTARSYVDGFTAYRECGGHWDGWVVENMSRDPGWIAHTPLGNQADLLQQTNVYWGGTRTIDGTETYLIEAYPRKDTLLEFNERRQRDTADLQEANLKNASVRLWVDAETYLPVQSEVKLIIGKGGATATARTTIEYRAYDESVEVEIPAGVLDESNRRSFCPGT